jgi:hypothetical protein
MDWLSGETRKKDLFLGKVRLPPYQNDAQAWAEDCSGAAPQTFNAITSAA